MRTSRRRESIDAKATSPATLNAMTTITATLHNAYRLDIILLPSFFFLDTYVFVIRVQRVPHGRHDLGHFAETRVGIFAFDRGLSVPEEECVSRNGPGKKKQKRINTHSYFDRTFFSFFFFIHPIRLGHYSRLLLCTLYTYRLL